jgi:hypothetical protein
MYVDTNVSEEHTVSIFRAEALEALCSSETYLPTNPHGVTTHKTNFTAAP